MSTKPPVKTSVFLLTATAVVAGALAPAAAADPAPQIRWEECPATVTAPGAQCGSFDTPMRYDDPDGPTVSIGVMKIPAANQAAKRGVLFGNPGGPGGDGYTYFGSPEAGFQWPQEIIDEWDRVIVQPRGLLHSTPLECSAPELNDLSSVARFQAEGLLSSGAQSRAACQGPVPGYAETITTDTNARDWEAARRALGYDSISIMGLSYGTYLGAAYATLFPATTDRVVLDSAMDPNAQWQQLMRDQQAGYESVLNEYFAWVAANNATYGMGDTPLKAYQYWSRRVVEETGTNPTVTPPPARVGDLPPGLEFAGQAGADVLTATGKARVEAEGIVSRLLNPGANQAASPLLTNTRLMLPQAAAWDTLARMTNGTFEAPQASEPPQGFVDELAASSLALIKLQSVQMCNENVTPADYSLIPVALWSNFVSGDIFTAPSALIGSGAYCSGAQPVTGTIPLSGAGLKVRPLQINATNDPQTPYHGRGTIANAMGSHLVTVHGPGHGHVGLGNKAVDRIVVDYLRSGEVTVSDAPGYFEALGQ
ncbi:alpha/beta fold hydrolase [Corynebacterium timonense]|uniref:TAP-like protein n=1 Tax=Corynebacterium timonense TaxID=441500 RepID=A0A1H1Q766_9CORY|nr:alpha/beta fold hydrolase [Corynebacterium timonense]SDS19351.1 TAP-like protein [Corynebacterium timonense]